MELRVERTRGEVLKCRCNEFGRLNPCPSAPSPCAQNLVFEVGEGRRDGRPVSPDDLVSECRLRL